METIVNSTLPILAEAAAEKIFGKGNKKQKKQKNKKKKQGQKKEEKKIEKKIAPVTSNALARTRDYSAPTRIVGTTPRRYFRTTNKRDKAGRDSTVVEGCDFFGTIGGNIAQYTEIFSMPLNPLAIGGTRLSIEASLWQKFRYKSAELIYIPLKSFNNDGGVLLSHADDPEEILGSPGTINLVNTLMSVPGAVSSQVFMEAKHAWSPKRQDKREFYITPDEDSEDRFTIQGILYILAMTAMNYSPMAMVFLKYKIEMYSKIVSLNNLGSYKSYPVVLGNNGVANTSLGLNDGGVLGIFSLQPGAGETGLALNTVYACYFTFSRGSIRAMAIAFFKTHNATITTVCNLYYTSRDASNQSGAAVAGSWAPGSALVSNATVYWTPASNVITPEKRQDRELEELAAEVNSLRTTVHALTEERDRDTNYMITTPSRQATQRGVPKF